MNNEWPVDPAEAENKKDELNLSTNEIINLKTGLNIGDLQ